MGTGEGLHDPHVHATRGYTSHTYTRDPTQGGGAYSSGADYLKGSTTRNGQGGSVTRPTRTRDPQVHETRVTRSTRTRETPRKGEALIRVGSK